MSKMVIVPLKVTEDMINAVRGLCWTNANTAERVQFLWDSMIAACDSANLADKNAFFTLGKKSGKQEVQEAVKDALGITQTQTV